jgi:hypothetical protein
MAKRPFTPLTIFLTAAAILPAVAQDRLDFPLTAQERSHLTLSLGSVGLDSWARTPDRQAAEDDPYHNFLIPSERPPEKVSGDLIQDPAGQ